MKIKLLYTFPLILLFNLSYGQDKKTAFIKSNNSIPITSNKYNCNSNKNGIIISSKEIVSTQNISQLNNKTASVNYSTSAYYLVRSKND